jgi:Calpain family cysteine protease
MADLSHGVRVSSFRSVADPLPRSEDRSLFGANRLEKKRVSGTLFGDGISYRDVRQGVSLPNCGMAAALSALAAMAPARVISAFAVSTTDHLSVRFIDADTLKVSYQAVDADFYVRSNGALAYGQGGTETHKLSQGLKLWYPMIEKAFAARSGSYDRLSSVPSVVLSQVLGLPANQVDLDRAKDPAQILLLRSVFCFMPDGERVPVVLTTSDDATRYKGTGLIPHHAYAVVRVDEQPDGHYVLTLCNAWGRGEPSGDGKDDGEFQISLERAATLFHTLDTVTAL